MIDYKDSNKEQMKELHYLTSKQEIASVSWNYEEAYAAVADK